MKIKNPTTQVTIKMEAWEVERLIEASAQVAEMYALGLNKNGVRWEIGDPDLPVISGDTFLFLLDFAKALREEK